MTDWGGTQAQKYTAAVLFAYGTTCHLCGRPGATTADHLTPLSLGGERFDLSNGRPAHGACNSARGNMTMTEWRQSRRYRAATVAPSRRW